MSTKSTLVALTVSTLAFTTAMAQDTVNDVDSSQQNWAHVRATLNADLKGVTEEVTATSAAIGNSFSAELGGHTELNNTQILGKDQNGNWVREELVNASVTLNATDQVGAITATAAAIGNSASVTVDDPEGGDSEVSTIKNLQRDFSKGSRASIDASVAGVDEKVELTAAAINNSFSADVTGNANISNRQDSWGDAIATTNLSASDTLGSISGTTAAIGNSASINFDNVDGGMTNLNSVQTPHGGNFRAELNVDGHNLDAPDGIENAIETTAAAMANSLSVEGTGNLNATNLQTFRRDVRATSNLDLENISGSVSATTAAIGNSASFTIEGADTVTIGNVQSSTYDPTAITNADLGNIEGDVTLTSAAMANTLSVTTLPSTAVLDVNSVQTNGALTEAQMNVSMGNLIGNASFTAAAIGNSVNISNLPQ